MANLQEKPAWEAGIYQLETSDPVLGGPDGIDNLQAKQLANRTVFLKKQVDDLVSGALTAEYADRLKTPRNIAMTGDGSWNVTFDASGNASAAMTLSNSGVTAGSYGQLTVDAKGRVTAARAIVPDDVPALDWSKITSGKPTTLAGYGIADGASKSDLQSAVNGLVSNAPANLNTLQELAAAINNDPKYSATVDGKLAGKADKTDLANAGIGGQARNINTGALTDLRPNGFYHAQADGGKGVTGVPGNGANGVFNVNFLSDKWGSLTYRQWGGEIYEARLENGAWSSFNRHWHSGNFNPDGKADKATTLAGYGITDGASKTDLKTAIDGVVAGAPGALNTLQELAAALGNDSNYAATITKQLSGKADRANTLAGYGIADAAALGGSSNQIFNVAPAYQSAHAVPLSQMTTALSGKADKANTLAGYGIADGASKADIQVISTKVDTWQANSVKQFANISRSTFYVGGSADHWYPVVIDLPFRMLGDIHISRHTHYDLDKYGEFNGCMYFYLRGMSGEWGGMPISASGRDGRLVPGILYPVEYDYVVSDKYKLPPVADYNFLAKSDPINSQLVVWLLGARSYDIITSYPAKVAVYCSEANNLVFTDGRKQFDIYLDAMSTVSSSMIQNQYRRGG